MFESTYNFRYDQTRQFVVLDRKWGDVNGDGVPDEVYLTGHKTADSPFVQQITLQIKDGRTGRVDGIRLKEDSGYNPTVFLGDFTGDGVQDILVSIDSGGSGATTYNELFSFRGNVPKKLYDNDWFMRTYGNVTVRYEDNYKVRVVNRLLGKVYVLDISTRDPEYLQQLYDESGQLKKHVEGNVYAVSGVYPIDLQRDGIYELWPFQRITGLYNADGLGYLQTPLSWNEEQGVFVPLYQWASVSGSDL